MEWPAKADCVSWLPASQYQQGGVATPVARRFEVEGDRMTSRVKQTARDRLLVARRRLRGHGRVGERGCWRWRVGGHDYMKRFYDWR